MMMSNKNAMLIDASLHRSLPQPRRETLHLSTNRDAYEEEGLEAVMFLIDPIRNPLEFIVKDQTYDKKRKPIRRTKYTHIAEMAFSIAFRQRDGV